MSKKPLIETNPFLKDPELRKALIDRSVASSSAIEGIKIKYPKLTKSARKKFSKLVREYEESCG